MPTVRGKTQVVILILFEIVIYHRECLLMQLQCNLFDLRRKCFLTKYIRWLAYLAPRVVQVIRTFFLG